MNVLTPNQTIFTDPGSKVTMDCKFQADHHDLFEFPILWRKRQIPDEDDMVDGRMGGRLWSAEETELEINVMSSINEPFLATHKYHVGFTSHPPIHNLQLTIASGFPQLIFMPI